MTVFAKLFSFQSLTLAAAFESLLVIKVLPSYYSSQSHLTQVAIIFLANYAFHALFWVLVYPRLLSPLRHIPGPRVSKHGKWWSKVNKSRPTSASSTELLLRRKGLLGISTLTLSSSIQARK